MVVRKLRHRIWRQLAAGALATVLGGGLFSADALGQEKKDGKDPPVLPPTKVEGTPTPPQEFPPEFPPQVDANYVPLSGGGVFGVPGVSGYRAGTASSGTKVDIPLIDYPGSIGVVTQDTIRDQQALRIDDILRDVGGATKLGDLRRDSFTVRGFEIRGRDYRWNGFLDPFAPYRDLANVERVEVLKGPASFLYGGSQPGGIVNIVTKRPQADTFTSVNVMGGSFGLFRTTVDTTGRIDQEGRYLIRINAAYEDRDSFRDFGFNERAFAAPAFTWMIDDDTALTFEGSYLNDRRRLDSGVTALGGRVGSIPISRFLGEPFDRQLNQDYKLSAMLTHRFDEDLTARLGTFATWLDASSNGTIPFGNAQLPDPQVFGFPPGTILRQRQNVDVQREQYYSIMGDINAKFDTGPFRHNVLLGTEIGWLRSTDFLGQTSDPLQPIQTPLAPFPIPFPSSPINVNAPFYGLPQPPLNGSFTAALKQERYGLYVQDLVDLNDRWKLLAGVRGDILNQSFGNQFNAQIAGFPAGFPFVEASNTYYRLSPRVGLLYQPVADTLSFYGTYGQSFDPPASGIFPNPQAIRPETGQTGEIGMRMNMLDNRLTFTAAGFYILKDNVVVQDNFLTLRQIGQQRSQGVELDVIGRVTDRFSIIANYAYVDARVLQDIDPTLINKPLRNVPYNNVNIWARYNFVDDARQTFGIALGMVAQGDRPGDLRDSFSLPGFARFDGGVFYRRGRLNANLYVENLFDRQYYTGSIDNLSVFPGAPITFRGNLGFTF